MPPAAALPRAHQQHELAAKPPPVDTVSLSAQKATDNQPRRNLLDALERDSAASRLAKATAARLASSDTTSRKTAPAAPRPHRDQRRGRQLSPTRSDPQAAQGQQAIRNLSADDAVQPIGDFRRDVQGACRRNLVTEGRRARDNSLERCHQAHPRRKPAARALHCGSARRARCFSAGSWMSSQRHSPMWLQLSRRWRSLRACRQNRRERGDHRE